MNPPMMSTSFPTSATKYYLSDFQPNMLSSANILFVADLPDETCEEDLSNFFHDYNYFCARVVHNINHTYSFVHFHTIEDAERARNDLNGVKLTPKYSKNKTSKPVRLCKYETKSNLTDLDSRCNLLVKNLSKTFSAHMLFKTFRKYGDIRSSKLVIDILGVSKGFGYVSFYKKEDAEKAKNELEKSVFDGKQMKVDFLEKGRKKQIKKNNIYVKHIPNKNFDEKNLKEIFERFGEITSAVVLKDDKGESKGFGFVCFINPDDAEKAVKEMKDKKLFDDVKENLYVAFAMKKGERKELLLKKRQEMHKLSQKMTIYAKIKDENEIESESQFETEINNYLKKLLSEDYKPKYIKIQIERKNAFITMNSQKEADEFVKKFHAYTIEHQTNIYFNLYKPKVDRINASNYFKRYNQFSETGSMASGSKGQFKTYNNFDSNTGVFRGPMPNNIPNMPMGAPQAKYKMYNNFDMPNNPNPMLNAFDMGQSKQLVQYNNFEKKSDIDIKEEKDVLGEQIYELVYQMYPKFASKITGMIIELDLERVKYMLQNEQKELKNLIDNAKEQLEKGTKK